MRKNKLLALGLATAMAVGAVGCSTPTTTVEDKKPEAESTEAAGGETAAAESTGEKIFRYSNTVDIATIDPNKTNAVADATVSY
ncbi:MAG: hypothetical protein SPF91_11590, partial [Clostridium sp.]|nr:hypothetical protein [Clostridium sp.]